MPLFRRILTGLSCAALLAAVSCGGGGSKFFEFVYESDWTFALEGITGESQLVRLTDPQSGSSQTRLMNNESGAVQTLRFPSITAGVYEIEATLYSQQNGQGTITGVFKDRVVASRSNNRYESIVSRPVASVTVTPSNATISVQESMQLYAVGKDANGVTTFVAPGSFLWEALNNKVSVNQDGIAIGELEGQGIIRATETGSGLTNTAVITVEPFQTQRTKWTIMVFLNAANDLDPFSDLNVNQMERVANNPEVRFIVQWKRVLALGFGAPWSGTRRYLVKFDSGEGNSWSGVRSDLIQDMGSGVDMGSPDTLRDFINWTMTFYPADRYVVVLWNHGSGWRLRSDEGGTRGFSFDDEFFTYIKTWELAQALDSTDRIDIVSWDASLMQMMEVAYEAKDRCDYMVGSEESPPAQGLPYDLVFGPLRSNADMPTEQLLQKFGDGMLQFYAGTPFKITQSSVRMSDVPALAAAVDALAVELIAKAGQFDPQIIQARNDAQSYSPSPTRVYRDLWHLAFKLKELINDAQIDAACDGVMAAVDQAVVHEAHNGFSPDSHGIAIEFGDSGQSYWSDYSLLAFSGATLWDEWLVISP